MKPLIICINTLLFCFIAFGDGTFANVKAMNIVATTDTINFKRFGAVGDGKTDNYNAFLALAAYVNQRKGGIVYLPQGEYYIAEYHTKDNKLLDIAYNNCDHIEIIGAKAVILLNGNFNRTADKITPKHSFSKTSAIIPLSFRNCKNIVIKGLEVNGGVSNTTRDSNVVEGGGYLLQFVGCSNIEVSNAYFHHAHTDGIVISKSGDNITANVKMSNVISSNNARQGMSIGDLTGGIFNNCKFSDTGITGGAYKFHSPGAGVDIEPGVNASVENVTFNDCIFSNNVGGQFLVSSPQKTKEIYLQGCVIDAANSKSKYTMILSAKDVQLTRCQINCYSSNIYPVWGQASGGAVTIKNCTIKSSSSGIIAVGKTRSEAINIDSNVFIFTGSKVSSYFPYLQNADVSFTNNDVYIPSKALSSKAAHSLIQNAKKSTGNKFHTDILTLKPKVSYTKTTLVNDK